MDTRATSQKLIAAGERLAKTVRFSRREIIEFARMSHDGNPLHLDAQAVRRAGFADIIASGQHSAAILMGMLATHFSRNDDGVQREMLCLNMNFAFQGPVFVDQDIALEWRVTSVEWNSKLQGSLAHLDGSASIGQAKPSVVARGTILVKQPAP